MPLQSRDEEGTPILSASINASFEAGFANNSLADDNKHRDSGFVAGRWTDIYFNGEMTADNGLTYGAQIRLAAGYGGNANNIDLLGHSGLGRSTSTSRAAGARSRLGTWIGAATALNLNVAGQYKGNGGLAYKSYIVTPGYGHSSRSHRRWHHPHPEPALVGRRTDQGHVLHAGVQRLPGRRQLHADAWRMGQML